MHNESRSFKGLVLWLLLLLLIFLDLDLYGVERKKEILMSSKTKIGHGKDGALIEQRNHGYYKLVSPPRLPTSEAFPDHKCKQIMLQ